jgi:GDPmannose 4,6-dehydratase
MKKKTAFITGISGQDGAYLSKLLLENGYRVIGGARRSAERSFWRLKKLGIQDQVEIVDFDLLDYHNMVDVIRKYEFDEVYNLAAQSFVGTSFRQPFYSLKCNGIAVCELVDIIQQFSPETKFYQASTSEMFGEVRETPQSEWTPFNPSSPYGIAKLMAHNFVEMYRDSYDFFGCCGILFNHESPLRGDEFVTKKITNYVKAYKYGAIDNTLKLGNINAERDWGFAGDYVRAMWSMMQLDKPNTYVIGTGEKHSVRDFVEMAFHSIGIPIVWEGEGIDEKGKNAKTGDILVEISEEFYRPNDVETLLADPQKADKYLRWKPQTSIQELVSMMVNDTVE